MGVCGLMNHIGTAETICSRIWNQEQKHGPHLGHMPSYTENVARLHAESTLAVAQQLARFNDIFAEAVRTGIFNR